MRIALFEPDIPQNTGTILRLAACLGLEAHIIEPAGFATSDSAFRRAGMDYLDQVEIVRHVNWEAFEAWRGGVGARLILFTTRARRSYLAHAFRLLFTTRARRSYLAHAFRRGDVLLFGRETSGVPEKVHAAADVRLVIPMREGLRSLNVAMAAAMAVGEAMRQTAAPSPTIDPV
jgi:tRNA (cytidine/uridine-2'-O-)-methyltransferase